MKGVHTCVVQVKHLSLSQCKHNNSGCLAAGIKVNGTLGEKNLITFFGEKGKGIFFFSLLDTIVGSQD